MRHDKSCRRGPGAQPARHPAPLFRLRPSHTVALALSVLSLVVAGSLISAPAAPAHFITPKSGGSPNANQIASLYKIILYIGAVVFVLVEGALAYSLIKFRAKKGAVAAQIHGNTRLEIGWTVGAAVILIVITVVTFVKLPSIINAPNSNANGFLSATLNKPSPPNGRSLTICVEGRQYIWRYVYGNGCVNGAFSARLPYSFQEMVVPTGTTVVLAIHSDDVIHSWWVPSLGGKVDAVPGYTTYAWFKIPHPGLFHGQCAQLCGRSHAAMTALVRAVPPGQYNAWLLHQQAAIQAANAQVTQLRGLLTAENQL